MFTNDEISDILWAQYESEFEDWLNLQMVELEPVRVAYLKQLKERKSYEIRSNVFRGFTKVSG